MFKRILALLLITLSLFLVSCSGFVSELLDILLAPSEESDTDTDFDTDTDTDTDFDFITEDGHYNTRDEVALYIRIYGHLPSNYITKIESVALEKIDKTKNIGGDYFGNFEGKLPKEKGREYHECDIDTPDTAKYNRGVKRIVFSNDRLIFYTPDHYETFYQYKDGAWEKI